MKTRFGILILTSTLLSWAQMNLQAQFPVQGDDTNTSLGQFVIVVNPAFQSYLAGLPYSGYNATTRRLTSPLMYDPLTIIGRSSPFLAGSTNATAGVRVGTSNTLVSAASFSVVPPGFTPAAGTREVYTQLRAFDLTSTSGTAVRAGTASTNAPASLGQVQSLSSSGLPANDFPARSFFDVFFEVDLPGLGTFSNATPVILVDTNLTAFPPYVIYFSKLSTAVPIYFEADNATLGAHAGDTFGILTLAGYGSSMSVSNDAATFTNSMQMQPELPVTSDYRTWAPNLTVIPLITSISLLGSGSSLIQVQCEGAPRSNYVLEATSSLMPPSWQQAYVGVANSQGNLIFTFPGSSSTPQQFFRVRSQ